MIPIRITPHLDSLTVRLDIPALSTPHSEALARSLPTQFGYAFQEKILSGTATQINLPYQSWRHMLGMTERSYRIHLAFETHPKSKPSKAQMDAPLSDADRLDFEMGGSSYPSVRKIPSLPDLWAEVGSFTVNSGQIRVTDPCYGQSLSSSGIVSAESGAWKAMALLRDDNESGFGNGMMVARLMALRDGTPIPTPKDFTANAPALSAGVDSAQCGFFDEGSYPSDAKEFEYETGTFYKQICESMSGPESFGTNKIGAAITPGSSGVASRTFYGDGSYDLFTTQNEKGEAVALAIVYDPTDLEFHPDRERDMDDEAEADAPATPALPAMRKLSIQSKLIGHKKPKLRGQRKMR